MDTPFFNDCGPPWNIVSPAAVTLAATDKALHLPAATKSLGQPYWWPGKRVRLEYYGVFTSAATPGNLSLALYWGTGADANGTVIAQMTATAWTASQSAKAWRAWFEILCTSVGATGALLASGDALFNEGSLSPHILIPDASLAAVTVDTTTSGNVISLQAKRSGSTAETMQIINGPIFTGLN